MNITVHSILDKLTNENIDFGLDDYGYNKVMYALESSDQYVNAERYEYFGVDTHLNFEWHMTDDGYEKIRDEVLDSSTFGWVSIGHLIVEFRCQGGGVDPDYHLPIDDVYVYGINDTLFGYKYKGVPYKFLHDVFLDIPKRRTMAGFQRAFEDIVVRFINDRPELISEALKANVTENEWN